MVLLRNQFLSKGDFFVERMLGIASEDKKIMLALPAHGYL